MDDQTKMVSGEASQQVSDGGPLVTLAIVVLFAAFPLLTPKLMVGIGGLIAVLTAIGWCMRWTMAAAVGVFSVFCVAFALFGLPSQLWFAIGLAGYAAALKLSPHREGAEWFRAGTVTRDVCLLIAVSILTSAIALVMWFVTLRPDIGDLIARFVPDWPWPALILGGLIFSMLNAAVEELAYRGVLMDALEKSIGPGFVALLGQAAAFGVLHINGFPRGWMGVALASVFGVLMGLLRRRSGGLLAPWAAHVCSDIVIVAVVVFFAQA